MNNPEIINISSEIWKNLPLYDILTLCRTNKSYNQICLDKRTWSYLLSRDFGKQTNKDPESRYIKELLKKFAKSITLKRQRDLLGWFDNDNIQYDNNLPIHRLIEEVQNEAFNSADLNKIGIVAELSNMYITDEYVALSALGLIPNEKKYNLKGNIVGEQFKNYLEYYECSDPELKDLDNPPTMLELLICASRDVGSWNQS